MRVVEVRTGNGGFAAIQRDNAFRKEIIYGLSMLGYIGGENVIKAAILSDDHNDVLDRGCGRSVVRLLWCWL